MHRSFNLLRMISVFSTKEKKRELKPEQTSVRADECEVQTLLKPEDV